MQIPSTQVPVISSKKIPIHVVLLYTVLISAVLYFGRALFIPLSFSLLISFILYPVCKWMESKGSNRNLAILVSIISITVVMAAVIYLLVTQLIGFSGEWQTIRIKLSETFGRISVLISERLGLSTERQTIMIRNFISSEILPLIQSTALSFTGLVVYSVMVPVFSTLMLYHRAMLVDVLCRIFTSSKKETILEILAGAIHAYYNFIKGMLLVYFIVGILNSLGLAIIGIPHPLLFGFIASVLTFIPYIGIIAASLLPIAISWITYNSVWYPVAVVIVFTIVQLLEAYIIFPFAVSSRLKVNTLVVLIVILAGGILWGAAGMILFIPFLGIIKLIADRTESLKTLSLLLDADSHKKGPV